MAKIAAHSIPKYKDLTTEVKRMLIVKTKVVPEIIEASRSITKSLGQYLSNITRKHEIKETQKSAIL